MYRLRQTSEFEAWFAKLRDAEARRRIAARLARLQAGLFGDAKSVGQGVNELRVHHGPGYRVYFALHGAEVILLLCGGDKDSQRKDILKAKALALQLKE